MEALRCTRTAALGKRVPSIYARAGRQSVYRLFRSHCDIHVGIGGGGVFLMLVLVMVFVSRVVIVVVMMLLCENTRLMWSWISWYPVLVFWC